MKAHFRSKTIIQVTVALAATLVLAVTARAYTATITDATLGAPGVCLTIEICWNDPGELPPGTGMTATGQEVDNPPLDPHDNLGEADDPTMVTGVYADPNNQFTRKCQKWQFCFDLNDCEGGNEEYSAVVRIHGQNVGTGVYEENIC